MLVLLTSEKEVLAEAKTINRLFAGGLEVLHLRKPSFNADQYCVLLEAIDPEYHGSIMIHEYHAVCKAFRLRGVHIQEQARLDLGEGLHDYVADFKEEHYKVSSSFHEPEDIINASCGFNYHFLSPVFSSISKVGYQGRGFAVHHIKKPIIGMGGISEQTIAEALTLGYSGVGVLGGVWNSPAPIQRFQDIKKCYQALRN
jgi:thiamine-phosphate pyrophosphorylase